MDEPIWIQPEQLHLMHDRQMELFGGSPGVLHVGAVAAALNRPINKWAYERAGLAECAAAYLYGIIHAHAYVDGNKRTALMAAFVFLEVNGSPIHVTPEEAFALVVFAARKEITEAHVVRWFTDHSDRTQFR
ncbi:MAG: type II toxin-antitoxin system death-on-curing family toxin [Gemmatimonadaceae bacterium]